MTITIERERFRRQLDIPQFGVEAQEKLRESRVAVLGVGGVGGPAALYLAAAGVGRLLLVDCDIVEISNLNRQILFTSEDLGQPKAPAAAKRLQVLDPGLKLEAVTQEFTASDSPALFAGCNFVLDCFDKNSIRLAVNRHCVGLRLPASHAFVQDLSGELITVLPGKSACLACVLDESFPNTEETPVLGVAAVWWGQS